MPKLELKTVQRELEKELVWPVYWLYGPEKLKSRELISRIRKAVLGKESEQASPWNWQEEIFDAQESDSAEIVDSARSPSLGGGTRLLLIRDAHLLKNPEKLAELFGSPQKPSELESVCVCISKDLDARKKFSKLLVEKTAVVACEEVEEAQRESWVLYLSKRRGIELSPSLSLQLCALDPWSLDLVERELEKIQIAGIHSEVVLDNTAAFGGADFFIQSFLSRDLKQALPQVSRFAGHPDEFLPLLGLLAWNVRQLVSVISDRENKTRFAKLNPYSAEKLKKWSAQWKLEEIQELQHELFQLDFSIKQKPLLPIGLWSSLVTHYCRM